MLSKAVLDNIIRLHNYENQFLPTALRRFFSKIEAPKERNSYLSLLLEKFSKRFISCNPGLGLTEDAVYILCFSLILLSVDLSSPAVKNKMSKREFIKNTRNALPNLNADFTGHLYDNIYLNGNIANATRLDEELVSVH
jgi:F-box protein 8